MTARAPGRGDGPIDRRVDVVAFRYPSRPALGSAYRRLLAHGVGLEGAADHGVSALYLRDPDGNGVELYYDRPREQ